VSFDLQPVLKGELLRLRPLLPEDFPGLFAVAADPRIWEQHPARDRYMEDVFRTFFREAMDSGGALIATDSKAGQVIGSSRFHGYDEEACEIENRVDVLSEVALGRHLQQRDEAAHVAARLPIRKCCRLPSWPAEPTLAEGAGENRWNLRGIKARWEWSRQYRLSNHSLDIRARSTWVSDLRPPADSAFVGISKASLSRLAAQVGT
jgi:hypothetical protein